MSLKIVKSKEKGFFDVKRGRKTISTWPVDPPRRRLNGARLAAGGVAVVVPLVVAPWLLAGLVYAIVPATRDWLAANAIGWLAVISLALAILVSTWASLRLGQARARERRQEEVVQELQRGLKEGDSQVRLLNLYQAYLRTLTPVTISPGLVDRETPLIEAETRLSQYEGAIKGATEGFGEKRTSLTLDQLIKLTRAMQGAARDLLQGAEELPGDLKERAEAAAESADQLRRRSIATRKSVERD